MGQVICVPMVDSHLDPVVQVHVQSLPDYFSTRMEKPFLRAFYGWFAHSQRAIAYVALDSKNEVLGFVVGAVNGRTYFNDMIAEAWSVLIGGLLGSVMIRPSVLAFLVRRSDLAIATLRRMVSRLSSRCKGASRRTAGATDVDRLPREKAASLVSIAVRASSRRMGVASRLQQVFIQEAVSRGCSGVDLTVRSNNEDAIRFYEHTGWSLVRKTEDVLTYHKRLCGPGHQCERHA